MNLLRPQVQAKRVYVISNPRLVHKLVLKAHQSKDAQVQIRYYREVGKTK